MEQTRKQNEEPVRNSQTNYRSDESMMNYKPNSFFILNRLEPQEQLQYQQL
jgi:hypothetical protein